MISVYVNTAVSCYEDEAGSSYCFEIYSFTGKEDIVTSEVFLHQALAWEQFHLTQNF